MQTKDSFAYAFRDGIEALTSLVPGSYHTTAPNGTLLALTYSVIPALNPIVVPQADPDSDEVATLAGLAARKAGPVPWSVRLRGEPGERLREIAARHGRTTATSQPFMTATVDGARAVDASVRQIKGDEFRTFATVVAGVFGAPPELVSAVYTAEVLDSPQVAAFLAETPRGEPVAAGVAVITGEYAGLANIGTLPAFRGQGHARKVTEALLSSGAKHFYLHADEQTTGFFERFGFATAENWTMLTP
ncbi:GNAT family N-acetyltransferase [Paractinoplanes deccanensis]|uniref:GNAT family N-acetyltransferase n=1 Tax=Paractinoplanes deccanensis TaxID=113561 RepID=UPI001944241A|nr:GNAT family N-acetyltransferase [Actinoplanes deccanensis]